MSNKMKAALFWLGLLGLCIGLIWLFSDILLPFALGLVVAYLLNPMTRKLAQRGMSRNFASFLIVGIFTLAIALFLAAALPLLYREGLQFAQDAPEYIAKLRVWAQPYMRQFMSFINGEAGSEAMASVTPDPAAALGFAQGAMGKILSGGQAVLNAVYVLAVMPVVAYFMLAEWENISEQIDDLIPLRHRDIILKLLARIDRKLAAFVRGQLTVMLLLGVIYAAALMIAGLKYGFFIGVASGILSIIPFVGSFTGFAVSVMVAAFQSGEWTYPLIIGGIFIAGQTLEGNFITPMLVGRSVGLHPLWIFFALMAGASVGGILGMLIAVPAAIVVSVFMSHAIESYRESSYYGDRKKNEKQKHG